MVLLTQSIKYQKVDGLTSMNLFDDIKIRISILSKTKTEVCGNWV